MSRSLALCAALASVAFVACDAAPLDPCKGETGACVALYVDGSPAPINKLTIDVPELGPGKGTTAESAGQKLFSPPIAVGVLINESFLSTTPREVTFAVTGFANAEAKGAASKTVSIAANEHVVVRVTLTNDGVDLSASTDLAGVDQAGIDLRGADLTTVDASVIDQAMPELDLEGALLDLEQPDLLVEPDLAPACGNGKVESSEQCDDGNDDVDDGCAGCSRAPGWVCPAEGQLCVAAGCGDGLVAGTEQCDDGHNVNGDGCTGNCRIESAYKCPTPGQPCIPTVCGDGNREGSESCDDSNSLQFDSCDVYCQRIPNCSLGACDAVCGDGIKLGTEGCDDGNNIANDGCSPGCEVEGLWNCGLAAAPTYLYLPMQYRDFVKASDVTNGHADFEAFTGTAVVTGLVASTLGSDGLPVFASSVGSGSTTMITSSTTFNAWFHNSTKNKVINRNMSLPLGRQGSSQAWQYDTAAFFPIDNATGSWVTGGQEPTINCGGAHNLNFTSQSQYFFVYDASVPPFTIEIRGDDDIWVFINKKLVIDMGGVHSPATGTVTVDASKASELGLVDGQVYRADIFHAERRSCASNFRITITNPLLPRSVCTPK